MFNRSGLRFKYLLISNSDGYQHLKSEFDGMSNCWIWTRFSL